MAIDRTELARWLREHDYALITREEQASRAGSGPGVVPWGEHRQALAKADAEIAKLRTRVVQLEAEIEALRAVADAARPYMRALDKHERARLSVQVALALAALPPATTEETPCP